MRSQYDGEVFAASVLRRLSRQTMSCCAGCSRRDRARRAKMPGHGRTSSAEFQQPGLPDPGSRGRGRAGARLGDPRTGTSSTTACMWATRASTCSTATGRPRMQRSPTRRSTARVSVATTPRPRPRPRPRHRATRPRHRATAHDTATPPPATARPLAAPLPECRRAHHGDRHPGELPVGSAERIRRTRRSWLFSTR